MGFTLAHNATDTNFCELLSDQIVLVMTEEHAIILTAFGLKH